MQPKTAEKNQIKFGSDTPGDKKDSAAPSPAEQWDQVAFRLIEQVLAPKGFKQIQKGSYRGLVVANSLQPGLIKSKVGECQKISAQLIRTFRGKAQRAVQDELKKAIDQREQAKTNYKATPFWRFAQRKRYYRLANSYDGYVEAYQESMGILLQLPIK